MDLPTGYEAADAQLDAVTSSVQRCNLNTVPPWVAAQHSALGRVVEFNVLYGSYLYTSSITPKR